MSATSQTSASPCSLNPVSVRGQISKSNSPTKPRRRYSSGIQHITPDSAPHCTRLFTQPYRLWNNSYTRRNLTTNQLNLTHANAVPDLRRNHGLESPTWLIHGAVVSN